MGQSFDVHGGIGRTMGTARNAALGEAIERYCLSIVHESDLQLGTADCPSWVDPHRFDNLPGRLDPDATYYWTDAVDVHNDETVAVPAQLVYCPFDAYETYIRTPITTGAAAHISYRRAVAAGLLESIEREAFIINYLHQFPDRKIPDEVVQDTPAGDVVAELKHDGFDVTVVYLSLDIPVHVTLCILWDERLKFVALGMDAGFDFGRTVEDAVFEAYHVHPWQRTIEGQRHNPEEIIDIPSRAEHWNAKGTDIEGIDHWINTGSRQFERLRTVNGIERLLEFFEDTGMPVYISDVTTDDVARQGFKAVRVLAPDLHPLYLDERYRYTEGRRLYQAPRQAGLTSVADDASSLNSIPHPFL
jgi:ribosomal protein S12 methylthiotransferase accessory factor